MTTLWMALQAIKGRSYPKFWNFQGEKGSLAPPDAWLNCWITFKNVANHLIFQISILMNLQHHNRGARKHWTRKTSLTHWINSLMDPFRLVSEITQMQKKLKFWITVVGLCSTLAWNLVLLVTFTVIGAKLAWISLKVVTATLNIVLACLKLPKTCIKSRGRRLRRISRQ